MSSTLQDRPAQGWIECSIGDFNLEVDWRVESGEVLVLFGPSGSGKTTMLRAVAGLLHPNQGRIEIGGRVVYDSAGGLWVPVHLRRVGYLTQQYHLFPHLTLGQNIAFGLKGQPGDAIRKRVQELLGIFQLEGLEERRVWELSGGQQQRVALARALAPNPEVLLLDEPFAALDTELRRIFRRELRVLLARAPIPVLLVTHDREEALALGDLVHVIDEGRSLSRGRPLDVLGQPGQGRVARLLGVENLLRLRVESRNQRDGTMVCVGEHLRLEVPLDEPSLSTGSLPEELGSVTVGIRSSDIILASHEPRELSARNRLKGVVSNVELCPPGYEVTLDCGVPLRCHVTGGALDEMNIRPGLTLWAVFKASSCFLVQEGSADAESQ